MNRLHAVFAAAIMIALGPALIALPVATPVQASPGDLDLAFGGLGEGGKVITELMPGESNAMTLQPDGKIVVAGESVADIVLMRYLPDGTLDPMFAGDGIAVLSQSLGIRVRDVAVQPDGKIVVAGSYDATNSDFVVARVTAGGLLDTTFGNNGFVSTDFLIDSNDHASALLVQPDGKVVAAGITSRPTFTAIGVARYNPNGSLDATFATDGMLVFFINDHGGCHDIALQSDGKLVLVGFSIVNGQYDFAVARVNTNGSLDNTFDGNAILTTDFGGSEVANAVSIQPDGKIVVAGDDNLNLRAARYLANGTLDSSFDGDGRRTLSGLNGDIHDVAVQPDGKIVLFGHHGSANGGDFEFYRLHPNGALDFSFNQDGELSVDIGGDEIGRNVALLADGRITAYGGSDDTHVLVRLWPNGSFDAGGMQTLDFQDAFFDPNSQEAGYSIAIQPDNKIVIAGDIWRADGSGNNFALARFFPDGRLDTSFGELGQVAFGFGSRDVANAVAIQPDGKIVAAGYTEAGSAVNFMVARFNPNGTADNTFGLGGVNVLDFLGGIDRGTDLALAPDGKIVVGGLAFNGARTVFGVARFNTNGTVDTSFDIDGKQLLEFILGPQHVATSVVVQPDRRIVLAGYVGGDFALVRFNENGSVDGSFGVAGKTITNMGGFDALYALKRLDDGTFVAAGLREISGQADFALARYLANGVLDPTFGTGGKAFANFGGYDQAFSVDVRGDGVIVAGGSSTVSSDTRFALAQFLSNGTLDTAFNGAGIAVADFVGADESAKHVQFHDINGIVAGGFQLMNNTYNMALARFETTPEATSAVSTPAPVTNLSLTLLSSNPTAGETRIAYELPRAAHVRIGIYDVHGRLVARPVDEDRPAGKHAVTWEGAGAPRGVSSGIYFVRLETGLQIMTRRLVILR